MEEIEYLISNLETSERSAAIIRINSKLEGIISVLNWDEAYRFFLVYEEAFGKEEKILNIILAKFNELIEKGIKSANDFKNIVGMDNLERFYWFNHINNVEYVKGYIAEQMSNFAVGIGKIIKLQEARKHFRKAQRKEDSLRVQKSLSSEVRHIEFQPTVKISENNPVFIKLNELTSKCLTTWSDADNETRFTMLVVDFAGIRPSPYNKDSIPNDDPFLSNFMTESGIIQKVTISTVDGRVNSGKPTTTREEIHNDSQEAILVSFLNAFISPVKDWLKSKDETETFVFVRVANSLQQHLQWEEKTTSFFIEGFNAWLSGYSHMGLAIWLPFFENTLRNHLSQLGEDVINPRERPGIEDFIVFETLLKKAGNHFDPRTVNYWHKVFSTYNGLGWNLRNAFCHGVLPLTVLKQEIFALAVLMAFLYLAQKPIKVA